MVPIWQIHLYKLNAQTSVYMRAQLKMISKKIAYIYCETITDKLLIHSAIKTPYLPYILTKLMNKMSAEWL